MELAVESPVLIHRASVEASVRASSEGLDRGVAFALVGLIEIGLSRKVSALEPASPVVRHPRWHASSSHFPCPSFATAILAASGHNLSHN